MTLTPSQLDEAEAIARAATQGECWYVASDGCIYAGQTPDEYGACHDVLVADMSCDAPWNRRYIARFSPAFALELIEDRKTAIKERDEARALAAEIQANKDGWQVKCEQFHAEAAKYREVLKQFADWPHTAYTTMTIRERARAALDAKTEGGGDE